MEKKVFREEYPDRMRFLPVGIDVVATGTMGEKRVKAYGLWDTGATHTVIAKHVADRLGIEIHEMKNNEARAMQHREYHGRAFVALQIGEIRTPFHWAVVADLDPDEDPDFLIGMNVIGSGRFEVDSSSGETVVTFEI